MVSSKILLRYHRACPVGSSLPAAGLSLLRAQLRFGKMKYLGRRGVCEGSGGVWGKKGLVWLLNPVWSGDKSIPSHNPFFYHHTQPKQADGLQQDGLFFHGLPESNSGTSLQGFSPINKISEEIWVPIPPPPHFAWLRLSHRGRVTGTGIAPVLRSGSASSSSPSINRGPLNVCPAVGFLLTQGYGGR